MRNVGVVCGRCGERAAYSKGLCQRCYYAAKFGRQTSQEQLRERNFVDGGVGVLTDRKGSRWLVDLEDFERCASEFWSDNGLGYASSNRVGYLHRFLLPGCRTVDHIDGDPHNCRRANLRDGGRGINQLNAAKRPAVSRYRGVSRMRDKWQATVVLAGQKYYLGTFADELDAARAVYRFAVEHGRQEFYTAV